MTTRQQQLKHIVDVILEAGDDKDNIYWLIATEHGCTCPSDLLELSRSELREPALIEDSYGENKRVCSAHIKNIINLQPFIDQFDNDAERDWTTHTAEEFQAWRENASRRRCAAAAAAAVPAPPPIVVPPPIDVEALGQAVGAAVGSSIQQRLCLFEIVFQNRPTGSSGTPHIHADLEEFPMDELQVLEVKECGTPLYQYYHRVREGKIYYARELQVQTQLENVVKDVIDSCEYGLQTDMEAALNGLKVDVWFLRTVNGNICGTMEVKQPKRDYARPPDPDPMVHPKVITQVLSQMIPLRTMYGVQNVYGILSTYSSWRFFRWLPEGEQIETDGSEEAVHLLEKLGLSDPAVGVATEESKYGTPRKASTVAANSRNSPPVSPRPHRDSDQIEETDEAEKEDEGSTDGPKRGTLYASPVIKDGARALRILAWVLGEMDRSPLKYIPAHQRDYLYVVQKGALGGYEKLEHGLDFYKGRMPRANVRKLYILEELGHGHHGRVYRAMSKNGNLCVMKYFVKAQYALNKNGKRLQVSAEDAAQKSVFYWNKAYDKWLPTARFGKWGGGDAILMPDLEKMSVNVDPTLALTMLEETMKERFFEKNLWHGDPAWRNVCIVRDSEGNLSKVCMVDLEPERMIEHVEASKWNAFSSMWMEFRNALEADWESFRAVESNLET